MLHNHSSVRQSVHIKRSDRLRVCLNSLILIVNNETLKMVVTSAFPYLMADDRYPNMDAMRFKEVHQNTFIKIFECIQPRRVRHNLPPLPEDKECGNCGFRRSNRVAQRRRRQRRQWHRLPALPEHDEY